MYVNKVLMLKFVKVAVSYFKLLNTGEQVALKDRREIWRGVALHLSKSLANTLFSQNILITYPCHF